MPFEITFTRGDNKEKVSYPRKQRCRCGSCPGYRIRTFLHPRYKDPHPNVTNPEHWRQQWREMGGGVELQPTSTLSCVNIPAQPINDDLRFGLLVYG